MLLPRSFYQRDAPQVARDLIGTVLIHENLQGNTAGTIVETEAYLGKDDPASHSFHGKTLRNAAMFGEAGHLYIYFIYGMYYCLNVVTGHVGVGEAVLIRSLEPLDGVPLMQQRRKVENIKQLCNGPAKLVQALGIPKNYNGSDLIDGPVKIISSEKTSFDIGISTRIGIKEGADLPLRFYLKGSLYLSKILFNLDKEK